MIASRSGDGVGGEPPRLFAIVVARCAGLYPLGVEMMRIAGISLFILVSGILLCWLAWLYV